MVKKLSPKIHRCHHQVPLRISHGITAYCADRAAVDLPHREDTDNDAEKIPKRKRYIQNSDI